MTKEDVLELLPNGTMGYFSTVNVDGFHETKFWQFQFEEAYSKMDKVVLSLYKSWSNPLVEIFYISDCEIKFTKGFGLPEVIK